MALTWESQGKLLRINNVTSSKKKKKLPQISSYLKCRRIVREKANNDQRNLN